MVRLKKILLEEINPAVLEKEIVWGGKDTLILYMHFMRMKTMKLKVNCVYVSGLMS